MLINNYVLRCPKCNNEISATWATGERKYSMQTLDAPYFMCARCRVIDINKTVVRRSIGLWRREQLSRERIPSEKYLYKETMELLQKFIDYYCRTAGYRRARFKKI